MSNGYVMALDVGTRRIGLALASNIAKLPAPLDTIDLNVVLDVETRIKQLVDENSVETLVVGLPRDMNGNETEQTAIARAFAKNIQEKLDMPVVMQDEAVTSVQAEERLKTLGKPYTKADIDAESACLILQDYLNQQGRNLA